MDKMTNDLISRHLLNQYLDEEEKKQGGGWLGRYLVRSYINNAPAANAVQVVYCKDCLYSRKLTTKEKNKFDPDCLVCQSRHGAGVRYWNRETPATIVAPKEYCSHGIRREDGR